MCLHIEYTLANVIQHFRKNLIHCRYVVICVTNRFPHTVFHPCIDWAYSTLPSVINSYMLTIAPMQLAHLKTFDCHVATAEPLNQTLVTAYAGYNTHPL